MRNNKNLLGCFTKHCVCELYNKDTSHPSRVQAQCTLAFGNYMYIFTLFILNNNNIKPELDSSEITKKTRQENSAGFICERMRVYQFSHFTSKYALGCAQAGHFSGGSVPSCT